MRLGACGRGFEPATFYKPGHRIILNEVTCRYLYYKWHQVEGTVEEPLVIDGFCFLKANQRYLKFTVEFGFSKSNKR